MELSDVMRTTGAVRRFKEGIISDGELFSILDLARFAPSGGNRQPWRLIIVKNANLRLAIRDLYVQGWKEYMSHVSRGLVPFAPGADGKWTQPAVPLEVAAAENYPSHFADNLHEVPVLMILAVELGSLACLDNGLDRQSIVGGGSIYPFAHNILLAARAAGLGGVMTTVICRREAELIELLKVPPGYGVAGLIALGIPHKQISKLTRKQVNEFTYLDSFGTNLPVPSESD